MQMRETVRRRKKLFGEERNCSKVREIDGRNGRKRQGSSNIRTESKRMSFEVL